MTKSEHCGTAFPVVTKVREELPTGRRFCNRVCYNDDLKQQALARKTKKVAPKTPGDGMILTDAAGRVPRSNGYSGVEKPEREATG